MTSQTPLERLRMASEHMRAHHGTDHPRHEFWALLAEFIDFARLDRGGLPEQHLEGTRMMRMADAYLESLDKLAATSEPLNRYYVFGYNSFYPTGGMGDCLYKTNDLDTAVEMATSDLQAMRYSYVSVWDVVEEKYIPLPGDDE